MERKIRLAKWEDFEIEVFIKSTWDIPSSREINDWCYNYDAHRTGEIPMLGSEYLAHLRHNGFPSPLMDWTSSPYVAAYFAFSKALAEKAVAIFIYCEWPDGFKLASNAEPQIRTLGPYVKTHRRHFLQKSRYTVCGQFESQDDPAQSQWRFMSHQTFFERRIGPNIDGLTQDALWKITIPGSERGKVMDYLNQYNINAFSLFDNEESLMEMLANQEIGFGA